MSLKTNFSSPCLEAGPTIRYNSFHTVDTRFTEQTPRYSDYYGQFAGFLKKESHYIFSKFHSLNTDILYGQFSVRINVTVVTKALILALLSFSGGPLSSVEPSPQKVLETRSQPCVCILVYLIQYECRGSYCHYN